MTLPEIIAAIRRKQAGSDEPGPSLTELFKAFRQITGKRVTKNDFSGYARKGTREEGRSYKERT
jgi:hypothetical protein